MSLKIRLLLVFLVFSSLLFSQELVPPLVKNKYKTLTTCNELSVYVHQLGEQSGLIKTEILGQSVQGRNIYALFFSASEFGKDPSKIKVLVFAQQHGNEQSGKEGALLLTSELLKPENRYLFNRIDFVLIPQMNPDGSEVNQRRNAANADLNRNHLILTEPETQLLHRLFNRYLFEVSMDVHEYSPYGEDWRKFGYRKNADITIGTTTNLNVSEKIRELSHENYLPFILRYLSERKFSSFEYSPGGPPEVNYIRHSTFDINDGRQSLGIQNTFSFIQEGMNGKDDSIENIQHRAEGQMYGMRGLLEYVYMNKDKIKKLIVEERAKLVSGRSEPEISVQSEHIGNGQQLEIPLFSYYSCKDSTIRVRDYRPVVKSLANVKRPIGYLIPRSLAILKEWLDLQSLNYSTFTNQPDYRIEQYLINRIDSIDFEGDMIVNPQFTVQEFQDKISDFDYIFVPTKQIKGNLLILALEPNSMLGLVTYEKYAHLLKGGEKYPVLRVMSKQ